MTVHEVLREQLEVALLSGRNAEEAATILGISRRTVYNWIKKFGLKQEFGSLRINKLRVRIRSKRSA